GLKLVAARGRLMQALPSGGAMAAVLAGENRVLAAIAACGAAVSIAAVNGPASVVVSGAERELARLLGDRDRDGVRTKRLVAAHAAGAARRMVAGPRQSRPPLRGRGLDRLGRLRPGLPSPEGRVAHVPVPAPAALDRGARWGTAPRGPGRTDARVLRGGVAARAARRANGGGRRAWDVARLCRRRGG